MGEILTQFWRLDGPDNAVLVAAVESCPSKLLALYELLRAHGWKTRAIDAMEYERLAETLETADVWAEDTLEVMGDEPLRPLPPARDAAESTEATR